MPSSKTGKYPLTCTKPLELGIILTSYQIDIVDAQRIAQIIYDAIQTNLSKANSPVYTAGMTVWNYDERDKPRALFYYGPYFKGLDNIVRKIIRSMIVSPRLAISCVRQSDKSAWRTATASDPKCYPTTVPTSHE
jgi:hypothetical protein